VEAGERCGEELALLRAGAGFPADSFYVPFLARATLLDHLPAGAAVIIDEESEAAAALEEGEREGAAVRPQLAEGGGAGAASAAVLAGGHLRRTAPPPRERERVRAPGERQHRHRFPAGAA